MSKQSGGEQDREGWKSPAGLSAIAAIATAIVAVIALLAGRDSGGTAQLSTGDASAGRDDTTTSATSATDDTQTPASIELGPVETVAELVALVDQVAGQRLPSGSSHTSFTTLATPDESVAGSVPVAWDDQDVTNWLDRDDARIGVLILAAEDISRFYNEWGAAGVFVGVSDSQSEFDPRAHLDGYRTFYEQNCVLEGEADVADASASGRYQIWSGCGSVDSMTFEYATVNRGGTPSPWLPGW